MKIKDFYLTYCTNIHPGETWEEVKKQLETYLPSIKQKVSPDQPLGVGLRLSDLASREILDGDNLLSFKDWLDSQDLYVFTMNGFPYGGFHRQRVKDEVHQPDWTTRQRLDYTLRLFDILANLLPEGMEGGISTSPISYKPWLQSEVAREKAYQIGTAHFVEVAEHIHRIYIESGKMLHLDMEPEPDGLIENTPEVLHFYEEWLYPAATRFFLTKGINSTEAKEIVQNHLRLCYDVCHYAVGYEQPRTVFAQIEKAGIKIGKIQISAALKAMLPDNGTGKQSIAEAFAPFVESTYLHQVVEQYADGELSHFNDLPEALAHLPESRAKEWRTHFHVPIFLENYGKLRSTQEDIVKVLNWIKAQPICQHLEVETYTWEVLPEDIRLELGESICRELAWVKSVL